MIRSVLVCAVSIHASVYAGVGSTGGGSAERFIYTAKERDTKPKTLLTKIKIARRKSRIQEYVQHTLKEDLKTEISSWSQPKIEALARYLSPEISARFRKLLLENLQEVIADIDSSPYFDSESATQIWGRAKDAVTVHDRNSPILYELSNLAGIGSLPKEPLLALFFHAHMRHFEFNDDDYQLGHVMTFARNPILLGALNAKGEGFWIELSKSILAQAWKKYASRPLLCSTTDGADLGMITCDEFNQKSLDQIFDRFPNLGDASDKHSGLNRAVELITETCHSLGIEPDLSPLLSYLNAQEGSSPDLALDIDLESFAKLIQIEKATSISWRVTTCRFQ